MTLLYKSLGLLCIDFQVPAVQKKGKGTVTH